MLFITFATPNDEKIYRSILPNNFTLGILRSSLPALGDLINYRLVVGDKQLCLDNENIFNRQKHLIQDNVRILLLPRAPGGTFIELSLLKEMLLEELKTELPKLNRETKVCEFCQCEELCAVIHCINVCIDCFPNYLQDTNFKLRCTHEEIDRELMWVPSYRKAPKTHPCGIEIDYRTLFKSEDFINKWSVLCDVIEMVANIDCQICYCGALLFNMTMYSKQQCSNCRRWLCFFCNRNWNEASMVNTMYTCTDVDCEYQRRLVFDLVPLEGTNDDNIIMIPDRRCCPKCFIVGGYGEKCKYHCCPHCKHKFCFICLETENDCKMKYHSSHSHQCTSVKKQTYSMFPRINES